MRACVNAAVEINMLDYNVTVCSRCSVNHNGDVSTLMHNNTIIGDHVTALSYQSSSLGLVCIYN